jgi:hypothetical protein
MCKTSLQHHKLGPGMRTTWFFLQNKYDNVYDYAGEYPYVTYIRILCRIACARVKT